MADKKNIEKNKKNIAKEVNNAKKIDIVEEAKKELQKLEKQSEQKKSSNTPWGYIIGTGLIVSAGFILGSKIMDMMKIQKLEAKLEEIVIPLSGGMKIEKIGKPKNTSGVYEFTLKFEGMEQEFTSYITGDSKYFFVEAIKVDELLENYAAQEAVEPPATCETLNKTDSPLLSVYVSSDCGYCKQAELAITSAIKQVPDLANKIKFRYPGSINENGEVLSFLGGAEAGTENLRQVCLRDEQNSAYWLYLGCMAEGGESSACLQTAKVNQTELDSCMEDENRGKAAITADSSQANLLQVAGTPSLFINESQKVDDQSFGGRTADAFKQILCCASNEQAEYCAQTLE